MLIENTLQFDNTLSVKQFAQTKEAQDILNNISVGKQEFIYNIGSKVQINGVPEATIQDRYKQNGYCYYTCIWTIDKRKKKEFFSRERQQDITLLEV